MKIDLERREWEAIVSALNDATAYWRICKDLRNLRKDWFELKKKIESKLEESE